MLVTSYDPEKRQALQAWGDLLEQIVSSSLIASDSSAIGCDSICYLKISIRYIIGAMAPFLYQDKIKAKIKELHEWRLKRSERRF